MSDQGPTVFNGRYELLRRIARGGMADVYLARDAALDRQVAVKVLFPEFANDPSFVERFRREAKAAANLSHPNIVGIYDWGQEQGTYYIVMEYVAGRSIADVLRSTGPLRPDRAAEIASDVAEALVSAHGAGLVHRDVKLGNVIVSDEGQVKVADFGIATALSRRTGDNLTQIGSVMGTATYFSPEQAQGKALDGRSDLYSLGVVLYEMIVGRPPFMAETSTAVAVKHVQDRPVPPTERGVSIAPSLEAIILKLLAKNPANRYPKAEDLRADLQRYLAGAHSIPARAAKASPPAGVRPPQAQARRSGSQPAVPAGPGAPRPAQPRGRPSGSVPAQPRGRPSGSVPAQPRGRPSGSVPAQPPGRPPGGPPVQPPGSPGMGPTPQYVPPAYYYEEVHRSDSWKRTALMLVGLAVLVAVLGVLVVAFYRSLGLGEEDDAPVVPPGSEEVRVEVPDLVGLSVADAETQLRELSLLIEVEYQINAERAENIVFRQSPLAGQLADEEDTVVVVVSQAEITRVPPVRGRDRFAARELLEGAGYAVIEIEGPSQAEVGLVVGQDPVSGTELRPGEAVTITISTGPGQIFVPDVRERTRIAAFQMLAESGFRVGEREEASTTIAEGLVIDTDPPVGSPVGLQAEIIVIVSSGLPLVSIPDVQGLLFDTGRLTIEREGLLIGTVTFQAVEPGSTDVGRILAQTPPPNLEVSVDTAVDLVVGEEADLEPAVPVEPVGPDDSVEPEEPVGPETGEPSVEN